MLNLPFPVKLLSATLVLTLVALHQVSTAAEPGQSKWEAEIQAFEAADRTNPPPAGAILFVGSSSIRLWKNLAQDFPKSKIIQRGFGGSQIADITAFSDRIIIPYRPKQVLIYAGDNDIAGGNSPEQVSDDFKILVAAIHSKLPRTPIVFISIKPSPSRWHLGNHVKKANALVEEYTKTNRQLEFIDVFAPMLDRHGNPQPELFLADNLHLNRKGYDLWVRLITPRLQR